LIIVLRIDADTVLHPVMVAGKVLYRVPGNTVPADRQRLLDLVARDTSSTVPGQTLGRMSVPTYPWQPAHMPLWPEDTDSDCDTGELRVVGGLTLPNRIVDRPWLDSRARRAAVDTLNNTPLRSGPGWYLRPWQISEARATTLKLSADRAEADAGVGLAGSAAYLSLSGRTLDLLVSLRWSRPRNEYRSLPLQAFYWALLRLLVTVASTYRHVARAIDAASPSDIRPFEAWLRSSTSQAFDVVDIGHFRRDNRDKPEGGYFPSARTPTTDLPDLKRLARNWLTYWLLEVGTRDFENWLAKVDIPHWLRVPDLVSPQ
jgi:hypothetical protein